MENKGYLMLKSGSNHLLYKHNGFGTILFSKAWLHFGDTHPSMSLIPHTTTSASQHGMHPSNNKRKKKKEGYIVVECCNRTQHESN